MKHFLTALLCLLLCGCAPQQTISSETVPQATTDTVIGTYDPRHPIESQYPGQVRAYPLSQRKVHGLRFFGSDVLILSGQGNTTLMLLTGDDLLMAAARTVGFDLEQNDPSLQFHDDCISFYDPRQQKTVLLDHQLQELRTIAVPQECTGKPILSQDTNTLYYCTAWSIVAWDLESGIRRTVKELQYSTQELTALHWDEQILECTVQDGDRAKILLLSADNGMEMHNLPEGSHLTTAGSDYFLSQYDGFQHLMIFSDNVSEKQMLLPKEPADDQYYLGENSAAVTVSSSVDGVCIDYYELENGILRSSLTFDTLQIPKNIVSGNNNAVYILLYDPAADCDTLYRWDVPQPDHSNTVSYVFPYSDIPDQTALEQCRQYADSIGEKYGLSLKIGEAACEIQPWDYQFTPEYLAPVLHRELTLLDQRLACYPQEILQKTVGSFSGLTICLVRGIHGSEDADSLHAATGIQFFENDVAYVAIATGKHSEQALYHELYHAMETYILTKSSALDQWEALNPIDFSYGNSDIPEVYLQGQTRAFVDSYSTNAAKEDRARVLENAMLAGREDLFRSEYMQRKLTAICTSIREAYALKKSAEILPWEQYLVTSLAPGTYTKS